MSTDDDKPARPYYPTPGDLIAAILGPLADTATEGFARANVDAEMRREMEMVAGGALSYAWLRERLGLPDPLRGVVSARARDAPPGQPSVVRGQPVVMGEDGTVARVVLARLARDAFGLSRFRGRDAAIALPRDARVTWAAPKGGSRARDAAELYSATINSPMEVQYVAVWSDPPPRREHPRRAFRRERRAIIREARARICPDAFELRVACLTAPERRGLQVRGFDVLRRALSAGRYRLGLVMGHLATLDPRRLP